MHRFIIAELVTQVPPSVEVSLSRMHFKKVAYIRMVKIRAIKLRNLWLWLKLTAYD
jgi:hypothetical protein